MASAEQPRSPIPRPPSLLRLNSHSNLNSSSHSSLPPFPSPTSAYSTLADGIKNSSRRMNNSMAHPPVGSSSSSIVSGAGDDRAGEGGQQRGAGTSATSGPVADGGHGSGSGSGDAAGMKPKKKKKKGWKGWALVLEDEEGNVIEVRDRGESPETEKRRVEEDAEKDRAGGREVAASREGSTAVRDGTPGTASGVNASAGGSRTRPRKSASPFVGGRISSPVTATPTTAAAAGSRSRKRTTASPRDTSVPAAAVATAPATATAPSSARSIPDRASSDLTDDDDTEDTASINILPLPAKRKRTVASGKPASVQTDSAPPSSDPPAAVPAVPPPTAKAAPTSTTAPTSKPKLINTRPSRATPTAPETRAGTSVSRTATPGPPPSAVVVVDDQPLPKVPRVGMGEVYPQPAESDIRAEANFIINAAKRKREEDRVRYLRENSPSGGDQPGRQGVADLTPPPSRGGVSATDDKASSIAAERGPRRSAGTADGSNGTDMHTPHTAPLRRQSEGGPSGQARFPQPSGPVASSSRLPAQSSMAPPTRSHQNGSSSNGNGQYAYLPPTTSHHSALARPPSHPIDPVDSFEEEFDAIEQGYLTGKHATAHSTATAARVLSEHIIAPQEVALGRGPNDPVPPRFHPGQKPTVVLAPEGSRLRPRDKFDKEHADGFDGLPPQVQTDCEGFVENVRENLRNIIMYFFPQPSVRRDAFLERVGRGLTDLGWNLVDNGDLALIRRQGDSLFMPPGQPVQVPPQPTQAASQGQQGYAGPPPRQDRR